MTSRVNLSLDSQRLTQRQGLYEMNIYHRTIVIDAVFSQNHKPFDCVTIMRYIKENEIQGKTIPHQEIAYFLDYLNSKGIINAVDRNSEYTKYQTA